MGSEVQGALRTAVDNAFSGQWSIDVGVNYIRRASIPANSKAVTGINGDTGDQDGVEQGYYGLEKKAKSKRK